MKKYQVKITDEVVEVRAPSIAQAPEHAQYLVSVLIGAGTVASVSRNGKILGMFERTTYGEWMK